MSKQDTSTEAGDNESGLAGFISHLVELRNRLLKSVLVVFVLFLALFPFANDLYSLLADPLIAKLPEGTSMIATQVVSPFLVPLKLAGFTALFVSVPYLLYQLWAFVAPGLYKNERQLILPLVLSSTALFYIGAAFAYFAVFPVVFGFLASTTPEGVAMMTDINEYLGFVITLFFAFGLAFEVPVATVLLVIVGAVTPEQLAEKRRYAILIAFIIGAILTPPDILSQFMMAIPVWMLYELGILISRVIVRRREEAQAAEEAAASGVPATGAADATGGGATPENPGPSGDRGAGGTAEPQTESDWDREFDEAIAAQESLEKDGDKDGKTGDDRSDSSGTDHQSDEKPYSSDDKGERRDEDDNDRDGGRPRRD
ncbi:MAG: twin-arginine translocase subunit TatC [Halothiobacillaceae bacterium]